MNIPLGYETVTLVRRVEDRGEDGRTRMRYQRHLLTGCSWRRVIHRTQSGGEIRFTEAITCRVPADKQRPSAGDYLFLGDVAGEFTSAAQLSETLNARRDAGAFIVTAVKDNARPGNPLPHWAALGE